MSSDDRPVSMSVPRFAGIATFARLPVSQEIRPGRVCIFGVPFDSATTYRPGTRFGPRAIRNVTALLRGYNPALGINPFEELDVMDYGDVKVNPFSVEMTLDVVTEEVTAMVTAGAFPVAMGGDHFVTLPLLRACAAVHGALSLVHFDSHPDTWDEHFGSRYHHGSTFRRAIEEGLVDGHHSLQVGIRGSVGLPGDIQSARNMGFQVLTNEDVFSMGIPAVSALIRERVRGPVYISLDIDAVDPAYAPGTGTPEVGGLTSWQMVNLVRGLWDVETVGFDLVEVSPPYDHGEITAILAANLIFEFLSGLALRQRRSNPSHEGP